jgi:hypothetical protein
LDLLVHFAVHFSVRNTGLVFAFEGWQMTFP